jgi:hypothetical protein
LEQNVRVESSEIKPLSCEGHRKFFKKAFTLS